MVCHVFSQYICFSLSVLSCFEVIDCSQDKYNNDQKKSTGECVANYHMVRGNCQACPSGYFGIDCLFSCPYPFFGRLCTQKCNCGQSECDFIKGCQRHALDKKTTIKSDCANDKETGPACCTNYHMVDGKCEACSVGYFGNNCGVPCQYPAFGQLCRDKCNCNQSDCNHIYGCKGDETTTITPSSSSIDTSVSKPVTTSLTMPITPASDVRKGSHKETFKSDDNFTVVLSVTAVSSVIIVLTIVITKLRCDTKDTIIYYINRSRRHRPVSFHDQFQVPFRNLETDIYMEIEEMEEVDDISIESIGNFQNGKREENEGLKFDPLTKPKPDSLQTGEKASFKTNVDIVLKPKPDTLKHKEKSFKKFEKYKTFTTRRFTNSKVHLKRYNSWHNVIEVPITLQSIRRTRSVLNISDEKFKHCILKM